MDNGAWPSDWLRGVLELCVLGIVADGPTHGYAVAQRLVAAGLGVVRGGTLYPLLNRLEADGHVRAGWEGGEGGPGRKVYRVTAAGRAHLGARAKLWTEFVAAARACVADGGEIA